MYEKVEAEAKKLAKELGYDKVPVGKGLKERQKEVSEARNEAYGQYLKLKAERDKIAVVRSNISITSRSQKEKQFVKNALELGLIN